MADPRKSAGLAVAATGAAVAGGKLVRDLRTPTADDGADRAFRLRRSEYVPDGVRRIARGQLDDAHDELSGASKRKIGEAVHETRKSLKRLRACVRLSRDAIGDECYQRENTVFRMAGRRLSGARDAQVVLDTLDALEQRFGDELVPALTGGLRTRLEGDRDRAVDALRDDEQAIETVIGELQSARARTPGWTFESDGFDALRPGLTRVYRRGRKRMKVARKDPKPENLHEMRKRVKDLWHASQILRPAAPKRMKKLSKRAHHLADLLGDDHDLSVLRDYIEVHPQAFENDAARQALLAVIQRRRNVLQRDALKLGKRLYSQPPKRFVGAIERRWRKRVPRHPQPLAG